MKLLRGPMALILTLFIHTSLLAEYLYKDELIFNPTFQEEIEKIGSELYEKTGVKLRLVMIRTLDENQSIVDYEKEIMKEFTEPTVLLTFSELDSKVDIMANPQSLYEYFDKRQILSPVSSWVQAFVIALAYAEDFDSFADMATDYGGTIIPLLAAKVKKGEVTGKYSGSMFNGYADLAEQIAAHKGVTLENAVGSTNQTSMLVIKLLFYGFVFYGIVMLIRRYIIRKREGRGL